MYDLCMSCSRRSRSVSDEERLRSKAIDKQLEKERRSYVSTIRLLLLGAGESGKSTFAKQMQIINMKGFSHEERMGIINDIYSNVRDSIVTILQAMSTLNPTVSFENRNNGIRANRILEQNKNPDYMFSPRFFEDCQVLWEDGGVQSCFKRSHEYNLIDSAKYFLDKISDLSQDEYVPSDQDILRCRVLTKDISEIKFVERSVMFHMFDVGGQRSQRRKWIQCFYDVTAIVFFTATSAYNQNLRECETKNRLEESLELFQDVWSNRFLQRVSVILFLNKQDILAEKITHGESKLEHHFPAFQYYRPSVANPKKNQLESDTEEVYRAKCFIRDQFIKIADTCQSSLHMCYPHFTCAVDTNNIRKVFQDCRNIIRKFHLDRFGYMPADM